MSLQIRLKKILDRNSITQVELSQLLEISTGAVNTYFAGKRKPNYDVLEKFYNLGYSIDWLISGNGTMKRSFINKDELDSYDRKIFDYFALICYINNAEKNKEKGSPIKEIEFLKNGDYYNQLCVMEKFYKDYAVPTLKKEISETQYYEKVRKFEAKLRPNFNVDSLFDGLLPQIDKFLYNSIDENKVSFVGSFDDLKQFTNNLSCLYFLYIEMKDIHLSVNSSNFENFKSMFKLQIDQMENDEYIQAKANRFTPIIYTMFNVKRTKIS